MIDTGSTLPELDPAERAGELVERMEESRKSPADASLTPQQKDAYLGLAAQLVANVQQLTESDVDMQRAHRTLTERIDANPRLMQYDPQQREYWEQHDPKFPRALDAVTIGLLLDQFTAPTNAHHVLQAVKYGMVSAADFDTQRRMYESILPRHGRVQGFERQGLLTRALGILFGTTYQIEARGDTLVIGSGDLDAIDSMLNEAAASGYTTVELHAATSESAQSIGKQLCTIPEITVSYGDWKQKRVPGVLIDRAVEYIPVKITLPSASESNTPLVRSQSYRTFNRMAEFPVSAEATDSLKLHAGNFHSFGIRFADEITMQLEQTWASAPSAERFTDRENGCYTFAEHTAVLPYTRWVLFSALPESRYVLAFMHRANDEPPEAILKRANAVLADTLPLEGKVRAIAQQFTPAFIRLMEYPVSGIPEEKILVG